MNKIIEAHKRGYRIDDNGSIVNPNLSIISGSKSNFGYYYFSIKVADRRVKIMAHRLMAYQKYGNNIFEKGIVVRHLDGNSSNNSNENIAIGTYSDNRMDMPIQDRLKQSLLAASYRIKYDKQLVKAYYYENGFSKTMTHFSISSKGTLSYILNH